MRIGEKRDPKNNGANSKAYIKYLDNTLAAQELGFISQVTDELDSGTIASLAEETPLGRLGTPEDIAKAVSFLASENADFITGQILGVDGGFC